MVALRRALALASCVALSARAQVLAPYSWNVDGGSAARLNNAAVSVALGAFSSAAHVVFARPLGEEDTESMVEEVLLPSPLVTSFGAILVVSDNCTLQLLPDPSSLSAGAPWTPLVPQWDVQDYFRGEDEESELSGIAMFQDKAFVLDGRNKAVHRVDVTAQGFTRVWTTFINGSAAGVAWFSDGDTGMIPEASTNLLWVPLAASYAFPAAGIAATIDMTNGSMTFVPVPKIAGCGKPDDLGSAAVDSGNVVLLSSDGTGSCGAVALDPTGAFLYSSFPDEKFLFDGDGEHTHPLFDADASQLYFLDFEMRIVDGVGQKLCCLDTTNGQFADCVGWANPCVVLPIFERVQEDTDVVDYRWTWMSMGLKPSNGSAAAVLFITASATEIDETFLTNGTSDLYSAIWAFDTVTGKLQQKFRFNMDLFNSAPLVVTGTDGITNVYVSSTLGNIYCFSSTALANGWLWRTLDLAPVPLEDLPASTYTFLSVTQKGTILATSTSGGATWQDQKSTFAVQAGVVGPFPSASPSPTVSLTPSASTTSTATATSSRTPSPSKTSTSTATFVPPAAAVSNNALGAPQIAGAAIGGIIGGVAVVLAVAQYLRMRNPSRLGGGEQTGLLSVRVRSASMVAVAFPGNAKPAPRAGSAGGAAGGGTAPGFASL